MRKRRYAWKLTKVDGDFVGDLGRNGVSKNLDGVVVNVVSVRTLAQSDAACMVD